MHGLACAARPIITPCRFGGEAALNLPRRERYVQPGLPAVFRVLLPADRLPNLGPDSLLKAARGAQDLLRLRDVLDAPVQGEVAVRELLAELVPTMGAEHVLRKPLENVLRRAKSSG